MTYLSEIRLCFLKDLSLTDCTARHVAANIRSFSKSPFRSMSLTNCPVNRLISYPGNMPPDLLKRSKVLGSRSRKRN